VFTETERLELALMAFPHEPALYPTLCRAIAPTIIGSTSWRDATGVVRRFVPGLKGHVRWLMRWPDAPGFEEAVQALLGACNFHAREIALEALSANPPAAAAALRAMMRSFNSGEATDLGGGFVSACVASGEPDTEQIFIHLLRFGSPFEQDLALDGLAALGTTACADALAMAARSWRPEIVARAAALRADLAAPPTTPSPALRAQLIEDHPDAWRFDERQALARHIEGWIHPGPPRRAGGRCPLVLGRARLKTLGAGGAGAAVDARLMQALLRSLAPPHPDTPTSRALLLEALRPELPASVRDAAAETLGRRAAVECLSAGDKAHLIEALEAGSWGDSARFALAFASLPGSLDTWLQAISCDIEADALAAAHQSLVRRPAEGLTSALRALYDAANPALLRRLLQGIDGDVDPSWPPLWIARAASAPPTERRALAEAVGRAGVEEASRWDWLAVETDPSVLHVLVGGLGAIGTRASLEPLREAAARSRVACDAVEAARAAIRARHPEDAQPGEGSVSLVGDVEGALSPVADAPRGALSPIGPPATTPIAAAPRPPERSAVHGGWAHIGAPPRQVPWTLRWTLFALGAHRDLWRSLKFWSTACLFVAFMPWGGKFTVAMGVFIAASLGAEQLARFRETTRLLRRGLLTVAEVSETEHLPNGSASGWAVSIHRGAGSFKRPLDPIDRAAMERGSSMALYCPGETEARGVQVLLCDTLGAARLDDRGQFVVATSWLVASLLLPAPTIAMTAWVAYSVSPWFLGALGLAAAALLARAHRSRGARRGEHGSVLSRS